MAEILVCQLARMGDIIQSLYLLEDLKQGGRDKLSLLVDKRLVGFVRAEAPWVDTVYGLDMEQYLSGFRNQASWINLWETLAKELQPLQGASFDRIVNLNYGKLTSAIISAFCKDRVVDGFYLTSEVSYGDPWVTLISQLVQADRRWNRFHLVDIFRFHGAKRAQPASQRSKPWRPLSKDSILGVQVATRHPKRSYNLDRIIEVIEQVLEEIGLQVCLLGVKNEEQLADYITQRIRSDRLQNLVGKTTLKDLTEVLRGCDRLLSGDTGTLHLAAWLGIPSVAVFFGPAYAFETGPYGAEHHVLQAEPPCAPCKEDAPCKNDFCRQAIVPEAITALLQAETVSAGDHLYSYRSEFVGDWLQYRPLERRKATIHEILSYLYWGGIGEFLGTPQGKLPSLTMAMDTLEDYYQLDSELLERDYHLLSKSLLPSRFSAGDKARMLAILQKGWQQLKERTCDGFREESGRLAATTA